MIKPLQSIRFVGLIALLSLAPQAIAEIAPSNKDIITAYTEAYNEADLEGMATLMGEAIEWRSLEDGEMVVYADGKPDLVSQMKDYIASGAPSVSELSGWGVSGQFTSVVETVSWTNDEGAQVSQSSIALYEIKDGLIQSVLYTPAAR